MRLATYLLSAVLLCLGAFSTEAAHTKVSLLLASESARPGDTVLAGLKLEMDPGWHTYWKNPGGPGIATKVEWDLPQGATAGDLQWPIPEKLLEQEFTTYVYTNEAVLLFALKIAPGTPTGPLALKGSVSWLECSVQCVPGSAEVKGQLNIGTEIKPSKDAAILAEWNKRVPAQGNTFGARASFGPNAGTNRTLVLEWQAQQAVADADFLPSGSDDFEILGATEQLRSGPGAVQIRKELRKSAADWPKEISGVIVQRAGGRTTGCEVTLPLGTDITGRAQAKGIWFLLMNALIGGFILNFMPCVLPVIGLKILGFVGQGHDEPRQARLLGLIYAAGVIASFLVIAIVVIAFRAAGHKVGWGLQFTNPYFLVAMTVLALLIALNLFGVFEVTVGGRTMDAAYKLSAKHGPAGAFFNGLLAVVLASSCTAPFFGAAVGVAFSQPPFIILLVLATAGIGLAAPYVILSWQPTWLRFLPKPGAWMERFKIAMGFPMLAAAVWLFSIAALHYGDRSLWLAIFLVIVALGAWVYGEFLQRHRRYPVAALLALACILIGGYLFALENRLRWREPASQTSASALDRQPGGVKWERWNRDAVAKARAEGKAVLVDFTAKWCLTCNTIVKPALESSSVVGKVRDLNAAAFLADYTDGAPEITEELGRYDRAGVPLVLVFPANPSAAAIVLPEAITPGMVVTALEKAVSKK